MSNSFYGTNTRGHLFHDMATPIESIINNNSQRFSVSNLLNLNTVDCKCRGICKTTLPLSRSNEHELCFIHI